MNKRQRKKAEKRTIHYISELRKTDKQAWRETMLRRRRHAMVYFFRRDTDAIRQIRRYNLLVYEMTEHEYWTYFIKYKVPPFLCQHRRRWLIDQFSLPYDIRIPSVPNGYGAAAVAEARATIKSPGLEVRPLEDALTQGFAAGIETGQWYQVTDDGPAKVELVNPDPLVKAAQKVAQAFENLAKKASETISEIFQR